MELKEFIFAAISKVGVVGFENKRADFLKEEFENYCDEVTIDTVGNVIGLKKGTSKGKIMYVAHADEIGLMITNIDEKGLLSFTDMGGFDQRTLVAQEVRVLGKEEVLGVIGTKPPHLNTPEDAKKAMLLKDLKIDTGLEVDKVKEIVSVGDIAVVRRKPIELLNNRIASNALDDIVGIGAMYEAMKQLQYIKHDVDVYFVASVQEEVTGLGAKTVARRIQPDIAIAIDVDFAKTPELSNVNIELGKGPVLMICPTNHRQILKGHKKVANENAIPYQIKVVNGIGGTDSNTLETAFYDIAVADLGIPIRYMHTSVEVVELKDVKELARLMTAFVQSFNVLESMEEFLCY